MTLADHLLDTHPVVVDKIVARLRGLSTAERVAEIERLHRDAEAFALSGVVARHPDASCEENRLRLFALRIPRSLMIDAYGWDPDERGR